MTFETIEKWLHGQGPALFIAMLLVFGLAWILFQIGKLIKRYVEKLQEELAETQEERIADLEESVKNSEMDRDAMRAEVESCKLDRGIMKAQIEDLRKTINSPCGHATCPKLTKD